MTILMQRFLIGLGLVILVVGCGRKAVPSTTTEIRDSIIVKEIPRIVEVPVPGETVMVTEYIECDSVTNKPKPKKMNARSGKAVMNIDVKADGSITGLGGCDSLKALVETADRLIERYRSAQKTEVKIEYEHQPYWYDIAARWIAGITLLFVLLVLFTRLKPKL